MKVCPPPVETESGPQFRIGQRLMKDFDLEEDGSLDLRKVGQHWGFERALVSTLFVNSKFFTFAHT